VPLTAAAAAAAAGSEHISMSYRCLLYPPCSESFRGSDAKEEGVERDIQGGLKSEATNSWP